MKRTSGHIDKEARLEQIRRRRVLNQRINEGSTPKVTPGIVNNLDEVTSHIYTDDEIRRFSMQAAIDNHPLAKKPSQARSKLAYKEIMEEVKESPRYMLPGMFAMFGYREPKYKAKLEYYDATPAVIFFGITRTKESAIRELGFNLHYFPPFARGKIVALVYNVFKEYYNKYFNEVPSRPNRLIDYKTLKRMLDKYGIGFGLRMYIPVLRGKTYILPTRLVPTLAYTEGHFNGATLAQIKKYWRRYR